MKNIPIIKYSHISDTPSPNSVGVSEFESQIAYLKKKQYKFLGLDEYAALKVATPNAEVNSQRHALIIFDGAWRDFYENALPILKHYWVKVAMFLATEWVMEASAQEAKNPKVIEPQFLSHDDSLLALQNNARAVVCTWEELKIIKEIVDYGSLTHTCGLSNYVAKPWHEDLALSQKLIFENLGVQTKHLLWQDDWDANNLRTAKKMGFTSFYMRRSQPNSQNGDAEQNFYFDAPKTLFALKKSSAILADSFGFRLFKKIL